MLTDVRQSMPAAGEMAAGPRAGIEIAEAAPADAAVWDAYVARRAGPAPSVAEGSPFVSGYHEWAWRGIVERTFGHDCVYLIARRDEAVAGILPLVEIKGLLFGRTMTSLPFVNYGGVVADSDDIARALVDRAAELAAARGAKHVELRHTARRFPDLPCRQHKVAMVLPLQTGMWDRIDRKARNQVRKAEKSNLTVERGGAELVADFYAVFARNMRDLGTPVYSRRLFEHVLAAFPDRARLVVVRLAGKAVAAGLTYQTRGVVEVPWASSIRDFNGLCPNHLLYWHIIETAVAEGCHQMDFGRSTPNEGTFKFKEQWGAVPVALHWEYRLLRGAAVPDQSPKNPKFQMAIGAWKRLPLWVANIAGPRLVRSIP